jgi:hypothetical protein
MLCKPSKMGGCKAAFFPGRSFPKRCIIKHEHLGNEINSHKIELSQDCGCCVTENVEYMYSYESFKLYCDVHWNQYLVDEEIAKNNFEQKVKREQQERKEKEQTERKESIEEWKSASPSEKLKWYGKEKLLILAKQKSICGRSKMSKDILVRHLSEIVIDTDFPIR